MTRTFYDVLGVSRDATTSEIRAAYRERLKESHPDLSDDDDANEVTRRIVRARDVLTDDDQRRRYDRMGHDEFVGNVDSSVDESDVSNAATAARGADRASERSERTGRTDRSRTERRRRSRARRRRERAARDRVGNEDGNGTAGQTGRDETTGTAGKATSTDGEATSPDSEATSTGDERTGTNSSGSGRVSGGTGSWNGHDGYSVRQGHDGGFQRSLLIPTGRALSLLVVALVLYPVMLFSALFPPFPLVVNVVVGLCAVFVVGYLQSVPVVGVYVFGIWSLATPMALTMASIPLTGLVGILALTGTWLPFGLTVLTFTLVRP